MRPKAYIRLCQMHDTVVKYSKSRIRAMRVGYIRCTHDTKDVVLFYMATKCADTNRFCTLNNK